MLLCLVSCVATSSFMFSDPWRRRLPPTRHSFHKSENEIQLVCNLLFKIYFADKWNLKHNLFPSKNLQLWHLHLLVCSLVLICGAIWFTSKLGFVVVVVNVPALVGSTQRPLVTCWAWKHRHLLQCWSTHQHTCPGSVPKHQREVASHSPSKLFSFCTLPKLKFKKRSENHRWCLCHTKIAVQSDPPSKKNDFVEFHC